jgi:hypothetical protein
MKKRITFVGLDTHKNSIEVALADDPTAKFGCMEASEAIWTRWTK